MERRTNIRKIQKKSRDGQKLTMVTAYDAASARLVDAAGIDMILVGDSVGMAVQGRIDTLAVEMDDMLYHTEIVARCSKQALIVGDMPFGSYQINEDEAIENAVNFLKAGANAVKLEGGATVLPLVERMTDGGIPVMGHLGYTPQSINQTSGPRLNKGAETLLEDAESLQDAGAFAIVLEMVPSEISKQITEALNVPTIGIGGGPSCSGQVLVFHDLLGFDPEFSPKFLKRYMNFHEQALGALKDFRTEVEEGQYPADEHSY
ncbi:MAG: 3-methyl-2-oxobutanoate hydroxymethyltransferase [Planctomycetes bacterium]|nr:3-methyl-2-oxobutanoate hydroxymethyltransferase [Planctomycetota bacterium]